MAIKVLPDLFAGDGERLARFTREAQTLGVDIATSPVFTPGKPRRLVSGRYAAAVAAGYDVSVDGSRFLMVTDTNAGPLRELRVVVTWLDQLQHQAR